MIKKIVGNALLEMWASLLIAIPAITIGVTVGIMSGLLPFNQAISTCLGLVISLWINYRVFSTLLHATNRDLAWTTLVNGVALFFSTLPAPN